MAGRLKEDERNERAIRGLLKLPENRRCINCNSLVCLLALTLSCCSFVGCEFMGLKLFSLFEFVDFAVELTFYIFLQADI